MTTVEETDDVAAPTIDFAFQPRDYLVAADSALQAEVLTVLTDLRYGSPRQRATYAMDLIWAHVGNTYDIAAAAHHDELAEYDDTEHPVCQACHGGDPGECRCGEYGCCQIQPVNEPAPDMP